MKEMWSDSMAYKALYRTYRPANFDEIAGQEHITRTFRNALKNNKIAHAYLFSGPRGTGKTSIAKIIAKAVNCEHAPIDNPCNECDICKGIDRNQISDVIEIDAASNNGVDEIREIRDKVKYLPGVGKYKVYIIDEVHMLSTGAFNALLKTLEEPPKHVIFILATTEPHKIPATIHSRCQRFDFRGVSVPEMIKRMNTIIKEEKIEIDDEAIKVIAESAEGGMRDAISLLDQVISYSDTTVTVDDVHAIRGTVSNERLLEIAQSIFNNDSVQAIQLLDELIQLGKEAPRLVDNLIKFYRDMLIYKNTNVSESDQMIYANQDFLVLSDKLSNNMIFYYIEVLNKTQGDMKFSNNAKLYMELALIKLVDKVEKQEIIFEDEIRKIKEELREIKETRIVNQVVSSTQKEEPTNLTFEEIINDNTKEDIVFDKQVVEKVNETIHEPKTQITEDVNATDEIVQEDNTPEELEEDATLFDIEIEEKKEPDYKTYDIRIVEKVLNNGNREAKIRMNSKWFDIERFVDAEKMNYAKWITSGRLVATNGDIIIIQYPNASLCNRMMKPDVKLIINELLTKFYGQKVDYLALPTEVWEQKSQEFIKKWKEDRDKYINLSPIEHPALKDIPKFEKDVSEFTPDLVKDAINLFGSDAVRVKKGEKK
jgi:DNA polymerase-3 subunit gamma/tau